MFKPFPLSYFSRNQQQYSANEKRGKLRRDSPWKSLNGDGDVWVERRIKIKGRNKSYWRSLHTNECIWDEPPSGASFVVFQDELDLYPFLRDFALGPLGKPVWTIEPAKKTPPVPKWVAELFA